MQAEVSSLLVLVAGRLLCRRGPQWRWMRCGSPAPLAGGLAPADQHPLALVLEVSENHQPGHVVHLGQRGAVVLGSLNGWEGQVHVHSAEMVDHLFQETAPEVAHGHES